MNTSIFPAVPPPGAIVDTTGTGDCFYAGLLTGLLRGMDVERAGRLGTASRRMLHNGARSTGGIRDFAATRRWRVSADVLPKRSADYDRRPSSTK